MVAQIPMTRQMQNNFAQSVVEKIHLQLNFAENVELI
jgi:hypothetical protein